MRAFDLSARNAEFVEKMPADIMFEVIDIIHGMIEIV